MNNFLKILADWWWKLCINTIIGTEYYLPTSDEKENLIKLRTYFCFFFCNFSYVDLQFYFENLFELSCKRRQIYLEQKQKIKVRNIQKHNEKWWSETQAVITEDVLLHSDRICSQPAWRKKIISIVAPTVRSSSN